MTGPARTRQGKVVHWVEADKPMCGQPHTGGLSGRPGYSVTCKACLRALGPPGRMGAIVDALVEDRKVLGDALRRIAGGALDPQAVARRALWTVDDRHAARLRAREGPPAA